MRKSKRKIFFIHLLNDYSGSPNIARKVVETLIKFGYSVQIVTSDSGPSGFLGEITGVEYKIIGYHWSHNSLATFFRYLKAQLNTFFYILASSEKGDLIYVNTILPVGGVIAGRIKGLKTICHIHEPYDPTRKFQSVLFSIIRSLKVFKIFVSKYAASSFEPLSNDCAVLYNCAGRIFFEQPSLKKDILKDEFIVFMACSLKQYKGVFEFIKIASCLPDVRFRLVLNTSEKEGKEFEKEEEIPKNLDIEMNNRNIWEAINSSDLVMNLSIPDEFVETFGLTLLEGLACGKPVIAPPVGGPREFVEPGKNGFLIDSRQTQSIKSAILYLKNNPDEYHKMSANAKETALKFTPEFFEKSLKGILERIVS